MVRRQDESIARQALTDSAKRAIMMNMCPAEFQKHVVLNSDRSDTYLKVKADIKN